MTLLGLHFGAPWALAALAVLPLLWLILRATPPAPMVQVFPPLRLLLGLHTADEARAKAPLWLILLRMLILSLAIVAFARPSLQPTTRADLIAGRVLVVVDNGWTSAPSWGAIRSALQGIARDLEQEGGEAHLLLTAPALRPWSPAEAMTPAALRGRAAQLEPQPWRPDRADAARRLESSGLSGVGRVIWLSDGIDDPGAQALITRLQALGPVSVRLAETGPRAIVDAATTADGVRVSVVRAAAAGNRASVAAETLDGRSLGVAALTFAGTQGEALIALPAEIAARTARVRIVGEESAGAVRLMPEGSSRPLIGLVEPGGAAQPLLSELYYVDRALQPYATLRRGSVAELLDARVQALVLPDVSRLAPQEAQRLTRWLEAGGLLVRFAGPRLANDADELVPVRLRGGARALGSSLSWEQPQQIAAFDPASPFAGLVPPPDVVVRRQLLADPGVETEERAWARLSDGSPLVTAGARGKGLIVLFHVSAGPDWSDLPLSGLYVQMLRRVMAFAGRSAAGQPQEGGAGPYVATRLVDGFGALREVRAGVDPIPAEAFAAARAGPATPPGLYERAGLAGAIPVVGPSESLSALALPAALRPERLDRSSVHPVTGLLLGLAAMLAVLDILVSLFLAGRLPALGRSAAAGAVVLLGAFLAAPRADAQPLNDDPTLTLRLAYVVTGDSAVDRTARAGLTVLSQSLYARTAVEPGEPIGVNLATDELSVFPFIYWPAPSSPQPLTPAALSNLDRYLRLGGLILLDTRDADADRPRGVGGPAAIMLRGIDAPPLEPVTTEHVVARSFYLLRGFPGRFTAPQLWAETAVSAAARDGVASLFVGDGDWASAWAGEGNLNARQRELSLRFGMNLVMVALTGNYKADQVHVPALLERLHQEGRP
jgi:hypothetical protein